MCKEVKYRVLQGDTEGPFEKLAAISLLHPQSAIRVQMWNRLRAKLPKHEISLIKYKEGRMNRVRLFARGL